MRLLLTVVFLLLAHAASAQPVTQAVVRFYNVGAAQPISSAPIPFTAFVCNSVPPTGSTVNPTKLAYDDPANPGKVCLYVDPGTGPLVGLPFSTTPLEATLSLVNSAGASPESARSNSFTRPGSAPSAPTGLRVSGS